MSTCDHPAIFNTMCVSCGKVVLDSKGTTSITVGGRNLQLKSTEAARIQEVKIQNLQKNNKLALVLDLDHTLLHAVQVDGQTPIQTSQHDGQIHHLPIEDIVGGTVKHLVMKKRPHLDYFLEKANELFQITIYTAGTKRYAEAVVKVLDPTKRYIADRIVSRAEGNVVCLDKSLDKIFIKDASMAVIVDDREDVWKGEQGKQLLLVRPYEYFFPGSAGMILIGAQRSPIAEVNNDPGATGGGANAAAAAANKPANTTPANNVKMPVVSLHVQPGKLLTMVPIHAPEYTEVDDQLLRCLDILRDLHKRYYAPISPAVSSAMPAPVNPKRSVASLLTDVRLSILAGCTICFSGIIPTNEPHPELHPVWKLAVLLGAQVSTELLPRTTHLLSDANHTKKVSQCLVNRGGDVWVLHVDWLQYCRWSLARAEESTFLLVPLPPDQFPHPIMDFTPLAPAAITPATSATSSANANANANAANSTSGSKVTFQATDPRKRKAASMLPPNPTANNTNNNNNENNNNSSEEEEDVPPPPPPDTGDDHNSDQDNENDNDNADSNEHTTAVTITNAHNMANKRMKLNNSTVIAIATTAEEVVATAVADESEEGEGDEEHSTDSMMATFVSQSHTQLLSEDPAEEGDEEVEVEDGEISEERGEYVAAEDDDEDDYNLDDEEIATGGREGGEDGEEEEYGEGGDGDCHAFYERQLITADEEDEDIDGFSYAPSLVDSEEYHRTRSFPLSSASSSTKSENNTEEEDDDEDGDDEEDFAAFEQVLLSSRTITSNNNNIANENDSNNNDNSNTR